ncbi:hypothetical protein [Salinilacihabitans rarus]|uniref:hypothetical protein n=1 Tax=Salinilacihabitans rarus TaxID=2961596 RepID=UPI0020C85340|nr:hypothetical protein [Salinilacihabitans rarus]
MGLPSIRFHLPPSRFVTVEMDEPNARAADRTWDDEETTLLTGETHWAKLRFVAGESGHGFPPPEVSNEGLREIAAALGKLEYEPRMAEEYPMIDDRDEFEFWVTLFEAYAAAGATVTTSY